MANWSLDDLSERIPSRETDNSVRVSIPSTPGPPSAQQRMASPADGSLDATRLGPREREILLRKNRKLAQIFGAESSVSSPQPRKGLSQSGAPPRLSTQPKEDAFLSPLVPSADSSYLENQDAAASDSVPSLITLDHTDNETIGVSASDQARPVSLPSSPLVVSVAERRQKIARLAKLHRYLGSGVPAERVFGITEFMRDLDLPPPLPKDTLRSSPVSGRKGSLDLSSPTRGEGDRSIPKLNDIQKAAQVRRASKMEKLFGDRPPQELLHGLTSSSHIPSPSKDPAADQPRGDWFALHKSKVFSKSRPGTPESHESAQRLLSPESETFRTYRDSINSIQNIADRDDAQSLVSVHQLLTLNFEDDESPIAEASQQEDQASARQTSKSERRRSLPVTRKDSLSSLQSGATVSSPPPEVVSFQLRRRRAAKLVDFFGVDYRVLFDSVLSTIELGVEEETSRGTLHPDETEILMNKLRALRVNDRKR